MVLSANSFLCFCGKLHNLKESLEIELLYKRF
nr:MAG TPA: hypothetical protein [Caudoviricetes sp.]